jgi:uncharacterized protein (DUF488 family)
VIRIFSIGYEGCHFDSFLEHLINNGIDCVVDVRDLPLSRKPGFSKRSLSTALKTSNIAYEHWRSLGAPKAIRKKLRNDGNWDDYRRVYNQKLHENRKVLEELAYKARTESVCLLCFERNYLECHRSLITDYIIELGLVDAVSHLTVAKRDRAENGAWDKESRPLLTN